MRSENIVEILLVEDNQFDAELTFEALRRGKLINTIHHVEDGAEALDFLFCKGKYTARDSSHTSLIVFLDMKLPKVDGLEVLRAMKSDERSKKIPVIILSSSRESPDIEEAYKLGVNSYVVKPVEFSAFQDVVAKMGLYWLLTNETPR